MKISSSSLSHQPKQAIPQNYLEIPTYFTPYVNYPPQTKPLFNTQSTQFHYTCDTTTYSDESTKFKWKDLMKLHIGSNNIETYQPYINNILYSSLDETEIQTLPETYIIHLVKLIQSIANIQTNKVNELTALNANLTEQLNELTHQHNTKRNNDELVSTLKKQNKHQQQIINTYRTYLSRNNNNNGDNNNIKHDNDSLTESDSNNNNSVNNGSYRKYKQNEGYYCMYCSGICFNNKDALEEHLRRRHLIHGYKVKDNNEDAKLKQLRSQREKDAKVVELKIKETKQQIHNALVEREIAGYYQSLSSRIDNINANIHGVSNNNIPIQYEQSYRMNVDGGNNNNNNTRYQPFVSNEMNQNEINLYKSQISNLQNKIEREERARLHKFTQIEKDINEQKPFMKRNISSMRQSQSYNMFLNSFNEENIERTFIKHHYIHPTRKHKQLAKRNNTQSLPKPNNNEISNVNNEQHHISLTKDNNEQPLQQSAVNNINILPINNNNEQQVLNEESVSQISQTIEEKELENFYRKFKSRDAQYPKGRAYYNVEIIPAQYNNTLNYNNINSYINDLLNDTTPKEVCGTSIVNYNSINNLNCEQLQHLITDLYAELGTKAENTPCFGYYSKTMDNVFEIRKNIEQHSNSKSNSNNNSEHRKQIQESYNSQY